MSQATRRRPPGVTTNAEHEKPGGQAWRLSTSYFFIEENLRRQARFVSCPWPDARPAPEGLERSGKVSLLSTEAVPSPQEGCRLGLPPRPGKPDRRSKDVSGIPSILSLIPRNPLHRRHLHWPSCRQSHSCRWKGRRLKRTRHDRQDLVASICTVMSRA